MKSSRRSELLVRIKHHQGIVIATVYEVYRRESDLPGCSIDFDQPTPDLGLNQLSVQYAVISSAGICRQHFTKGEIHRSALS